MPKPPVHEDIDSEHERADSELRQTSQAVGIYQRHDVVIDEAAGIAILTAVFAQRVLERREWADAIVREEDRDLDPYGARRDRHGAVTPTDKTRHGQPSDRRELQQEDRRMHGLHGCDGDGCIVGLL